jgi:hypothetical protein
MVRSNSRKRLPPYISYRTFQNFIDRLQEGIPARIDRSYWGDRLSGSNGTQLMTALRFLNLVDVNGTPTSHLRLLVSTRGVQKKETLRQIASESFVFLSDGSFDIQTATYAQLEESFRRTFELTDSVNRKCVKFFVTLASDAGMPLSQFITRRARSSSNTTGTRLTVKRKGTKTRLSLAVPQESEKIPATTSWDRMLLAKFPSFDPTWSDEVKLGWLEAFDGLKFPVFDPVWSDEVKIKWFEAFDRLLGRKLPKLPQQ